MTVTDNQPRIVDSLQAIAGRRQPASRYMATMVHDLLRLPPKDRHLEVAALNDRDAEQLHCAVRAELGTEYGLYVDDPVGFVHHCLGETTWSKQRAVLRSVAKHKRTAVPSAFGTGKTHIAARVALWRSLVYPVGTSLTVTTATRFRQVQRQLWPHIRQCVAHSR